MSESADFTKLVPGFEFLQNLVKNAGVALPSVGQWVAPTLDPEELDKRIGELRTVQFWLEQNANMLGTTIQALEVQRMTLSTLKNMNVQMTDLREALTIRMPEAPPEPAPRPTSAAAPAPVASEPAPAVAPGGAAPKAPASVVDPMQWWSALTRQFTELAANAMRETAAEASKAMPAGARAEAPKAPDARPPAKKSAPARRRASGKRAAAKTRGAARG